MDKKYRIFKEMDITLIDVLLEKSDLSYEEYWVLKYSLGNETNKDKVCRLDICERLSFSFATLTTIKRVALSKVYKVYKDHIEKLKN